MYKKKQFVPKVSPIGELNDDPLSATKVILRGIENTTCSQPYNVEYRLLEIRERSFESWPQEFTQMPKVLSKAGFFKSPQGLDSVTCYVCNLTLSDWPPNANPLEWHAIHFDKCDFVKLIAGAEFIALMQKKKAEYSELI